MALNNKLKTLETCFDNQRAEPEPESEEDLEELESDVKKMAEKILEYRTTAPDQFKTTIASIFSTQRPGLPHIDDGSDPGAAEHNAGEMEFDEERRMEEKIQLLKGKILSNVSTVPVVLRRMQDCISRIEKLESCNGIIHPAFKKTKLVDQMNLYFQLRYPLHHKRINKDSLWKTLDPSLPDGKQICYLQQVVDRIDRNFLWGGIGISLHRINYAKEEWLC